METNPQNTRQRPLSLKELNSFILKNNIKAATLPIPNVIAKTTVAKSRKGGPVDIGYEVHGNGPVKLIWLAGHGASRRNWNLQIRDFSRNDTYSSLYLDNRGTGQSTCGPFSFFTPSWTISDLALDTVELLDSLGWTSSRQLHIIGESMGGMIAQHIAIHIPHRIASLTLVSTTTKWMSGQSVASLFSTLGSGLSMVAQPSANSRAAATRSFLLGENWLMQPDEDIDLARSESRVTFPTNADNWTANVFLLSSEPMNAKGGMLQTQACMRHCLSDEEVEKLRCEVGTERIQVIHGSADETLPALTHGRQTVTRLGGKENVKYVEFEGSKHLLMVERRGDLEKLVKEIVEKNYVN